MRVKAHLSRIGALALAIYPLLALVAPLPTQYLGLLVKREQDE